MALDFPHIDPVAFAVGPLVIRWYALAYLAGFLLGWRYALYLAKFYDGRPNREDIEDFIPWAVIGVILGGRIGYVLFYQFEHYMSDPWAILKLWQGGMSFHGGAAGVILALCIYPFFKKLQHLRLADIVCAAVPIGLFFGRLANFANGELYGKITDVSWAVKFPHGGFEPRHPSQLYEAGLEGALLFLILFALIRNNWVREHRGIVSGAFLLGYACFRSFVELFREPDAQLGYLWNMISMGQLLSLPMAVAGMGLILYATLRKPQASDA